MSTLFNSRVKYLCYIIELIVLLVLQNTTSVFPEILSVKPMLILASVVTISFLEDEVPSMLIGMIGGLLIDFSFGKYFGLFGMIMAIICCVTSVYVKNKVKINMYISIRTAIVAVIIAVLCVWIFRYVIQGHSAVFLMLFNVYIPILIYTLLCLPNIYLLNLVINKALKYNEIV